MNSAEEPLMNVVPLEVGTYVIEVSRITPEGRRPILHADRIVDITPGMVTRTRQRIHVKAQRAHDLALITALCEQGIG